MLTRSEYLPPQLTEPFVMASFAQSCWTQRVTVAVAIWEPCGSRTSALALGDRIDALIGYDDRLLEGARAVGLAVERPT